MQAGAEEANELARLRAFSWSRFLTRLEKTLPNDVRVVSVGLSKAESDREVRHAKDARAEDSFAVALSLVSRDPDGLPKLIRAFYASPWFDAPTPVSETGGETGERRGAELRPRHRLPRPGGEAVSSATTAFRDRRVLFVILLVAIACNAAVLLSYRTFYDERLRALVSEKASLEKRRDEARRRTEKAEASERRLFETQEALTAFFSETLGKREERIAPLIEEIYATTRAAGLRPDAISYASTDEPGTDSLTMTFAVAGPYGDVKRLLSGLETLEAVPRRRAGRPLGRLGDRPGSS